MCILEKMRHVGKVLRVWTPLRDGKFSSQAHQLKVPINSCSAVNYLSSTSSCMVLELFLGILHLNSKTSLEHLEDSVTDSTVLLVLVLVQDSPCLLN